jgi:outer membrane protein assembly factor BamB
MSNFSLGRNLEYERGFCGWYIDSLVAVDGKGKILFKKQLISVKDIKDINLVSFPFATGDFDGNGFKDDTVVAVNDKVYVINKNGDIISAFTSLVSFGKKMMNFSVKAIEAGRLIKDDSIDQIIASGKDGVIAYDIKGNVLWNYQLPVNIPHGHGLGNLLVSDINGDEEKEVIAGIGNAIFILSNNGELIDRLMVNGDIHGYGWGSHNPAMDIADINNDGFQEILTVTTEGTLYIFGIKK